jgi:hypothetical protein
VKPKKDRSVPTISIGNAERGTIFTPCVTCQRQNVRMQAYRAPANHREATEGQRAVAMSVWFEADRRIKTNVTELHAVQPGPVLGIFCGRLALILAPRSIGPL